MSAERRAGGVRTPRIAAGGRCRAEAPEAPPDTSRPLAAQSGPFPAYHRASFGSGADEGKRWISNPELWPYLMTVTEVAEVLRVQDVRIVRGFIDSGELPAINIGGTVKRRVRVPRDNLRAFIHRSRAASKPEPVKPQRRKVQRAPVKLMHF